MSTTEFKEPLSPWRIFVSSPFYEPLKNDPKSGPRWLELLFPDLNRILAAQIELLEALLYPGPEYPLRRSSPKERRLVFVLDDMSVRF